MLLSWLHLGLSYFAKSMYITFIIEESNVGRSFLRPAIRNALFLFWSIIGFMVIQKVIHIISHFLLKKEHHFVKFWIKKKLPWIYLHTA